MHNTRTNHFQQHMRLNFLLDATLNVATWSSGQLKFHYLLSLNVHCLGNKMEKLCSVQEVLYKIFQSICEGIIV